MLKLKKGMLASVLSAMVLALSLPIMNVSANENLEMKNQGEIIEMKNQDEMNQGEMIKYLDENQVPKEKQKVLLEKLKNNQLWDCYDEEKVNQMPEDFSKFDPADGSVTRYHRFDDGSFIKIESTLNEKIKIENTEESRNKLSEKIKDKAELDRLFKGAAEYDSMVHTDGVMSGSGYAWYYDYYISKMVGTMKAWFYADFTIVNGGADSINFAGCKNPGVSGWGAYSDLTMYHERAVEDVSMSRYARINSTWAVTHDISTPWGGSSTSGTYYLFLAVGNNSYYVDNTPHYN